MPSMRAMVLERAGAPLVLKELPRPMPEAGEVLVRVGACGVCRTDLHIVDGELHEPRLPLIPGHEVVGTVAEAGAAVSTFRIGDRIGIPWLASTCGKCAYCARGAENLCANARFTGYTRSGGYAEYVAADAAYCFPLTSKTEDVHLAPLLCAGLIGYRSYRMLGEHAEHIGFYGFGAAAHILTQLAAHEGRTVYAFTRPGDAETQSFALQMGAAWAGDSTARPPLPLDGAIVFAPVGALIPLALAAVDRGGTVVCGGIHMSDIPSFPYSLLWGERAVRSVANLTRDDGHAFFRAIAGMAIRTQVEVFPLREANEALRRLREGRLRAAAVLEAVDP